ncbi:MAG: membrane protein insertase YidC [Actinobacteria bacterium]|nr:membrane protein insertase YidC [Actinomycetota bacterium]
MSALDPLNNLVAWVIMRIHAVLGGIFGPSTGLAWGLSIVILVLFIRLLLVPLFVKQVNAQRKMAQHAPQLQELRKKYKNDKQRLNEETMKFYKENGVNPLAGCLPMIPQMIVFFALFNVLRAITDWKPGTAPAYGLTVPVVQSAQRATIFGVHLGDKLLFRPAGMHLSLHVVIVIVITVTISATTTFMTVRQSAKRGLMQTNVDPDNPMASTQKYMQYVVPFFSLTGLYWQYGLVLYWVTTNLWTLGQQYFMFRNWSVDAPDAALAGATTGGTARAAQGSAGPNVPRPGGSGSTKAGGGAKGGTRSGSAGTGNGSGTARAGTAARQATSPGPADAQDGAEKRGLLRLGRAKAEPAPEPEAPVTKVVRQQPVRQARSKRSGKR